MNQLKLITYGFVPLLGLLLASCASTESKSGSERAMSGYVQQSANQVVRTGANDCLHTGTWSREGSIQECDPQFVAKAAPPPVAQAETGELPPPVPAQPVDVPSEPAPQRTTERLYLGADAYFEFNQAELRPQAETALGKIAERAKDVREATIEIVGHADQIGSEEYNLALSQRRADAVRAYLVDQGLSEEAIRIEARGESDPIVRCEGRQGADLVNCLQPNRRSEIIFSALEESEAQ
jgi:OOP family OmpA-OmpF porin